MEDHVKAIEDHLGYLKKDMGYDEDHEDRDEKDTEFKEGKSMYLKNPKGAPKK